MPTGAAFYINIAGFNKQDITPDFRPSYLLHSQSQ